MPREKLTYGYAKVWGPDQDLSEQISRLEAFGVARTLIYVDKDLSAKKHHTQFNRLMRVLHKGDVVVVSLIECLGLSCTEVADTWEKITKDKKADILVLDMPLLDTRTTPYNMSGELVEDVVLQLLSRMDQIEKTRRMRRQADGIASAKARGVHMGRPAIEQPASYAEVWEAFAQGEITRKDAATQLGVSLNTVNKWFRKSRAQGEIKQGGDVYERGM